MQPHFGARFACRHAHQPRAFGQFPRHHTLAVAFLAGEFVESHPPGAGVVGDHEHRNVFTRKHFDRAHHFVFPFALDARHARGHQPHGAHFFFREADAHAARGEEHDFVLAVGEQHGEQGVARVDFDQSEGLRARGRQGGQFAFLHHALPRDGEHEALFGVGRGGEERHGGAFPQGGCQAVPRCAVGGGGGFRQGVDGHRGGLPVGGNEVKRIAGAGAHHGDGRMTPAEARRFAFRQAGDVAGGV